jgi:lipoate-protein ligase A
VTLESWNAVMPADWQLLRTPPASGAYNMAVDAALLGDAAARGTGVWRCYDWALPTISFGRNEAVRTRFDDASVAAAGFDVVRRPTGGRALLHMAEVTYSVTMPLARSRPWQAAYALINEVLLSAVQSLGVDAELVTEHARVMPPDGRVCFAAPSLGEIAVRGAKLAGSAVWRDRGAYLQHGSILLADRQTRIRDAARRHASTPEGTADADPPLPPAAALGNLLSPPPSWADVAEALEQALARAVTRTPGGSLRDGPPDVSALDVARHEVHFRDTTWLWRR